MIHGKFPSRCIPAVTAWVAVLVSFSGCGPAESPEPAGPPETVSSPTSIDGPDWSYVVVQDEETYTPDGATSSLGHGLEYRIDWGDEKLSDWTDQGAGHTWEQSGDYPIKAQARCKEHPEIVSPWSKSLITVRVTWE